MYGQDVAALAAKTEIVAPNPRIDRGLPTKAHPGRRFGAKTTRVVDMHKRWPYIV